MTGRRAWTFIPHPSSFIPMKFVPLGDQAVLAYLPDEPAAVRFAAAVRVAAPPWLEDVVPAYASVGVFFDADRVTLPEMLEWLERVGSASDGSASPVARASGSSIRRVPVVSRLNSWASADRRPR